MTTPSDPQWQGQQPGQQQPPPPPGYQGGPPPGYQGGPPPGYQGGPPPGYQSYQGGPPPGYQSYQGGPPQQGQSQFSGFMPPGIGGVPLLAEPPASIQMAFKLLLALSGVYVLGGIIRVILLLTVVSGLGLGVAATGSIVGLVFALVLVAIFLYFVYQMRAGRDWARITVAVLTGLSALGSLIGLISNLNLAGAFYGGTYAAISLVVDLVELGLAVGALVFMFKPDAKPYFAAMSGR